jgi:Fe-Mn family superoxide dismutase
MAFTLPALPYAKNALAPHLSEETLDFHWGKHHNTYVVNLNGFVEKDAGLAGKTLEDLVRTTTGPVFNNAAQIWNHTFYWESMKPQGGGAPTGRLAELIDRDFGSFSDFKAKFSAATVGQFGSGWGWLVQNGDRLEVTTSSNAGCPLTEGKRPILTCDVWEHAYYIDYRNARAKYVEAWWSLVNWEAASARLG